MMDLFTMPQTSIQAHASVTNKVELYTAIMEILSDGLARSDEGIEAAMNARFPEIKHTPSGLRTRRSEMAHRGEVIDSGLIGQTKTGRATTLWKLKA